MSEVIVRADGALGRICLNRPEALNALTGPMLTAVEAAIDGFLADPAVQTIALTGEGSRGLCAGGDIKVFWQHGRQEPERALALWRQEYRLNLRLSQLEKSFVAIMDGICMGGGVGLSVHGRWRVVTPRTRFAMPETAIGYFPDIGASWFLPRLPDHLGYYLGVTGAVIGGADVLAAGLADAMIDEADIPALLADLAAGQPVADALAARKIDPGPAALAPHRALISRAFSQPDLAGIYRVLRDDGSDFAAGVLAQLGRTSPSAQVLTLALLQRGATLPDLRACLGQELAANHMILGEADFYEGIRAAVIDKDRQPRWQPADPAQVDTPALLARLEAALARGDTAAA